MNLDQLEEWGTWAPRNFAKPPTRRVGKRLIREGEIPGEIIDNKPYVYVHRAELGLQPAAPSIESRALELLS